MKDALSLLKNVLLLTDEILFIEVDEDTPTNAEVNEYMTRRRRLNHLSGSKATDTQGLRAFEVTVLILIDDPEIGATYENPLEEQHWKIKKALGDYLRDVSYFWEIDTASPLTKAILLLLCRKRMFRCSRLI